MSENKLKEIIEEIYNELKDKSGGKVANYIPQLEKMNADLFGISVCTVNGDIINVGDYNVDFCLQSCSKPLSYCLVREKLGREKVHSHVGYEPSGREFNAHVLNKNGLPHNPMINAGAMMISSLLHPKNDPSERFEYILKSFEKISGNIGKIGFDNSVFLSEAQHADRNLSLAYYMRENKAYDGKMSSNEMRQHLDLYFQTCSITINTKIGSVICSTLANGGVCPITNEKIFSKATIRDCLTLMYNCGMYDFSGQFAFEIGLPAKSGVSGCIFLVIPNVAGICIFSPPLDDIGNSFKGIQVCKKLGEKLNYHIFDNIVSKENKEFIIYDKDVLTQKLLKAASNNDVEQLSELIKKVDINSTDYDLRTALHIAVADNNKEAIKFLLENNADPNIKDRWGNIAMTN